MGIFALALQLKLIGAFLIILGLAHAFFEQRFGWREDAAKMSRFNEQIFYVHNFFIGLICVMMGALALFGTRALTQTSFAGGWLCGGLTIFWACRLAIQFAFYDPALRRGKVFETTMHCVFAASWLYLTGVFAWAWWRQIW